MLYAVRYDPGSMARPEEAARQRELARRLLAYALKRETGADLCSLQILLGPHGKPSLRDFPMKFSLSHCAGLVCCGLWEREIGVDVERIFPWNPRLAKRICTPEELACLESLSDRDRAFTALWTLKESLMKFYGLGFSMGFRNAAFTLEKGIWQPLEQGLNTRTSFPFPGCVLSVCCRDLPPAELVLAEEKELF